MQMTTDARLWLDAAVRRILARHPLGDAERAGITYELMSHLHAAGEARASAAGRAEVARADLEAALAEAGGEAGLAAAFVQPLAKPVERVLFWRRLGAFGIDVFILGIALSFLHGFLPFLAPILGGAAPAPLYDESGWFMLPWGFHDPTLPLALQALIATASVVLVLAYFTWLEGRDGRSLGKRALDITVVRLDGRPMTYREAFARNFVKLSPPILALEALVMLAASQASKQRLSDKIVGTIVVRT